MTITNHSSAAHRRMAALGSGTLIVLSCVLLLSVTGCGSSSAGRAVRTALVPFSPEQQADLASLRDAEYRLRAGDRLGIDFKYEDDLDSSNLLILPDGRLTLPGGVRPVLAKGLSVSQLDSALSELYARDYRNPELSVIVESLADLDVYVFGFVRSPGQVKLPAGGMSVMQAVAAAGGFDNVARPKSTVLMRVTPEGFMLRQIDLSHLERRGFFDAAVLDLQPYDVIYVPRSAIGDLKHFSDTVLSSMLNFSRLFWDIHAISNLKKVTNIWR